MKQQLSQNEKRFSGTAVVKLRTYHVALTRPEEVAGSFAHRAPIASHSSDSKGNAFLL